MYFLWIWVEGGGHEIFKKAIGWQLVLSALLTFFYIAFLTPTTSSPLFFLGVSVAGLLAGCMVAVVYSLCVCFWGQMGKLLSKPVGWYLIRIILLAVCVAFFIPVVAGLVEAPMFFMEVVTGGVLTGVMYSLVAIGFVVIYKSSGVFNFAQGTMLLFAGLTFVKLAEQGVSFWVAFVLTLGAMVVIGLMIERFIMRPLANQSLLSLFMATVGLSLFLEGFSQNLWDSAVHGLKLASFLPVVGDVQAVCASSSLLQCWYTKIISFVGFMLSSDPLFVADYIPGLDLILSTFDIFAALVAGMLIIGLVVFFKKARAGLALRAVSDDHLAAISVGIPLSKVWALVWSLAGIIALIAGLLWADKISVSFTLTQVVLKGLPVILVGGLTSIPGAIVAGFIIGLSEKLGEIYVSEWIGGQGIENWFGYMVALLFILVKPAGLFGEKEISRA